MAEIQIDGNTSELLIKIAQRAFDVLLITRVKWRNLDGPSTIQRPRLNHNDSQGCISSEPLIED